MSRKFKIVEAGYPKKFVASIAFIIYVLLGRFVNIQFPILKEIDPSYSGILLVVFGILPMIYFMYFMYVAESFKEIGFLIFSSDHLTIETTSYSESFNYSDLKDVKFIYNGIFGDTNSLSLDTSNQINTKDGSGNFFIFTSRGKTFNNNIILEDSVDVRVLRQYFEIMRSNFNLAIDNGKNITA